MIEKIYSKIDGKLLHIVNRFDYIKTRTDIVPEENFIQCATLKMEKGKTFPANVIQHIDLHDITRSFRFLNPYPIYRDYAGSGYFKKSQWCYRVRGVFL